MTKKTIDEILDEVFDKVVPKHADSIRQGFYEAHKKTKASSPTVRPWTTTDDERLINMSNLGYSAHSMAQILDRTQGAVYMRTHKLKKQGRL